MVMKVTKFSNLSDLFDFLDAKRAEIAAEMMGNNMTISSPVNTEIDKEDNEPHSKGYSKVSCSFNTDTTMIMENLNLDENVDVNAEDTVFDDMIDDIIDNFSCDDSSFECYNDDTNNNNNSAALEASAVEKSDPLGLDSLDFPLSQFPTIDEEDGDGFSSIPYSESKKYNQEDDVDEFDDMSATLSDNEEFDIDVPMSQFPNTLKAFDDYQFDDDDDNLVVDEVLEEDIKEESKPVIVGFTTGRGVSLPPPSREAIKRACSLIDDVDDSNDLFAKMNSETTRGDVNDSIPSIMPMFAKANGKSIPPPSEESLKRAKCIIEEPEVIEDQFPKVVGFTTGKGKALPPPSEESIKRANALISCANSVDLNDGSSNVENEKIPENVGFSTGKGRAIALPSAEALERAKNAIDGELSVMKPKPSIAKRSVVVADNRFTPFKPPSRTKNNSNPPPKPLPLSNGWKRPRKTPSIVDVSNVVPSKAPVSLFNLSPPETARFKLRNFFQKTPNLTISAEEYRSFHGICDEILRMDSIKAKEFKFHDGWGAKEAHEALLSSGAQSVSISLEWTLNHFRWIIWKFCSLIRAFPDAYSVDNLSPSWVTSQLLYRYEREVNCCQRSSLKKIIERDDAAGKYICLLVAAIDFDRKSLELTDGWYSIWTVSDTLIWDLVEGGKLVVGAKLEICLASLASGSSEGIPALEASSPASPCKLQIYRNACRLTRWDTKLGYLCGKGSPVALAFLKKLHQIHPQGGLVPAINVVIDRIFPLLYREEITSDDAGHVNKISRNERDHFLYMETHPEQAQQSKFSILQRIRVREEGEGEIKQGAIISFWNPIESGLLKEGVFVNITNLRACSRKTNNSNSVCSNSIISLSSTKSTRVFKSHAKEMTSGLSLRSIIDLSDVCDLDLNRLSINDFYDITAVSLGKVGIYHWFGSVNPRNELICVKMLNTGNGSSGNNNQLTFALGEVVCFRDLVFVLFDAREGVSNFGFNVEYSDFSRDKMKRSLDQFSAAYDRFLVLTTPAK